MELGLGVGLVVNHIAPQVWRVVFGVPAALLSTMCGSVLWSYGQGTAEGLKIRIEVLGQFCVAELLASSAVQGAAVTASI